MVEGRPSQIPPVLAQKTVCENGTLTTAYFSILLKMEAANSRSKQFTAVAQQKRLVKIGERMRVAPHEIRQRILKHIWENMAFFGGFVAPHEIRQRILKRLHIIIPTRRYPVAPHEIRQRILKHR